MIKANVKVDDLVKLKKKMASKDDLKWMHSKEDLKGMASTEDLKGMDRKEDVEYLKELMNDIKHSVILHVSTQEEDKEENEDLFQSCLEKIEKKLKSMKLESSKASDSLEHHGFNLGPRNYFISKIDMRKFDGKDPVT